MIARRLPEGWLYDQEALAEELKVSVRTVRRRVEAIACDVISRAPLYDPDEARQTLAGVRPRPARSAAAQLLNRLQLA